MNFRCSGFQVAAGLKRSAASDSAHGHGHRVTVAALQVVRLRVGDSGSPTRLGVGALVRRRPAAAGICMPLRFGPGIIMPVAAGSGLTKYKWVTASLSGPGSESR